MAAETNLQTVARLAADVPALYMKDKLLPRPERTLVFWNLCEKSTIPRGEGKTCQFTRYERMALPTSPLEESVTPTATPIILTVVQAVVDQWGAYGSFSDMAELTVRHPVMEQLTELLGLQRDELLDREVQVTAMGSTAVSFASTATSRATLAAGMNLASADIREVVALLRQNGSPTRKDGLFEGILDPFVEGDLNADTVFQAAAQNAGSSQIETLRSFNIGKWLGVMWSRSNLVPIIAQLPANHVTIAASTGAITGATLFSAGSPVRVKATRLDPSTGFEVAIGNETLISNAAAFHAVVTIDDPTAIAGVYFVYSTMEGGATGTATFQVKVTHAGGADTTIVLVKAGAPTPANAFVVQATGKVAPPDCPASINIHTSYIFGRGSLGATTLSNLQTFMTPKGAVDSDPLAQRRKAGWKQPFKSLILNPNFFRRIESASAFN
jgi:N4-gp56 family major capsid protein